MAINYAQLFGDLGVFLKSLDQFRDSAAGLNSPRPNMPTLLSGIETELGSTGRYDLLAGVHGLFDGYRDALSGWSDTMAAKMDARLNHRETVLNQLPALAGSPDTLTVLLEMSRDMRAVGQSIKKSVVSAAAAVAVAGNSGNGKVVTTTKLDGVNPPTLTAAANPAWAGLDSELAVPSETLSFTCVADEDSSGAPEGQEIFRVQGQPGAQSGRWDWRSEGSGSVVDVYTNNAWDVLSNRDFEIWSPANVPAGWTIKTGTPGVQIIQETTTAFRHRGTSALKIAGPCELRQRIAAGTVEPRRMYCLSVCVRGDAAADGDLYMGFVSDSGGYVATVDEQIYINSVVLNSTSSAFAQYHIFFVAPVSLPADLEFQIVYDGTVGTMRVDSLAFGPATYVNGIGVAILAGSSQFIINDRINVAVTNTEGIFQRFFRRAYGVQMPSNASPTIADALAL